MSHLECGYSYRSRRNFLKLTASSTLVGIMPAFVVGCGQDDSIEAITQYLIGLLNDPKEASKVGRLYILQSPMLEKQSYGELAENILSVLGVEQDAFSIEQLDALSPKVRNKVQQDYRDENIVILKGWMLSKTEAMLCALASTYSNNLFVLVT